jgi:hypothetical protein
VPFVHSPAHRLLLLLLSSELLLCGRQRLTDATLKKVGRDSLPVTPIVFLPFHQIDLLLLFDESLSLSEQSFGVKD